MLKKIVRESSSAGPCIVLGDLVKRTDKTITYKDRFDGTDHRIGGWRVIKESVHTGPCSRCKDHPETVFPNGYMD